jgi:hypothetical protein
MFDTFALWSEGQYEFGWCSRYVSADDLTFYRDWWDDTVIPASPIGREMLRGAADAFSQGVIEAARKPPTADQCDRVLKSWEADLSKQAKAAP